MLSFVSGSCVVDKGESNIVWAFSVALQLKSLHNFHMCSKIAFIVFYTKPLLSKSLVNLWKLTKDKVICVFLLSTCIKIDINIEKELDLVLTVVAKLKTRFDEQQTFIQITYVTVFSGQR